MTPILVVSPAHRLSASIPIAANRAGETGILDLGYESDSASQRQEIASLRRHARNSEAWGVRWDCLESQGRSLDRLQSLLGSEHLPVLILGGVGVEELSIAKARQQSRAIADRVFLEVTTLEQARWAEQTGFDGIIVRGFEAGGRVSFETTFCLLQRLSEKLHIPFWAHGGIGPDTAASALLAGAAGIVLCEQTWLAAESPLSETEKQQLAKSNETIIVGDHEQAYRFLGTSDRKNVSALDHALAAGEDWHALLVEMISVGSGLVPVGQDILLAQRLADRHINVAGIVKAYRLRSRENFKMASRNEVLAPAAPLAESLGIKYPIFQGPVAGITEEPAFCRMVSDAGALPLLALSGQDVDEARQLLERTAKALAEQPWGVAVPYSSSANLRERYFEQVLAAKPPVAVIDGRDVERVAPLEKSGTTVYLHVHTLELLESLLKSGQRRFIIEGSECGGPLGPRSSFSLWQCAIDSLLAAKIDRPENVYLIFAGPIHDSLSAAMTAAAVAPLSARGMKVGVQIGSAYFFTPEAVQSGIITREFHNEILHCREIAHLQSDNEVTIRCIPTPFVDEFNSRRSDLIRAGKSMATIGEELSLLVQQRLTLAAKGMLNGSPADVQTQRRQGLYRVGEVAVLRDQPISLRDLHEEISQESVVLLEKLTSQRLPWHPEERPARPKSEDIALVGMSCMFPKADDMRQYWENICRSIDAVEEVDPERWDPALYFDSDRLAKDRVYSKWGGFLNKVTFDPMKWRIPPAALKAIEPIQLLALDVAFRAMADAGYDKREFPRERTGVLFACAGSHDLGSAYAFRTMMRHFLPKVEGLTDEARDTLEQKLNAMLPEWTEDSFPGFLLNVVAGRVARELNVNGPNYTVDAACAASLAAFHAAIEQLRSNTSDMVLVGGVDWGNNPMCYMSFSKTHALSPRGRSRPFDESGDGIALGEGIGVVILKRLKDAERDGDKIYAVIKGIGSSSDGKNKSLTAPHPPGQIKAVERAYEDAQVCPTTISLVEAHGTGTVVGDGAEITTLSEVFGSRTDERQFAAVGSVKSMIGHTKTVAGMASMIKTALALKHRVLPPTIGVDKPTSRFDFANSPFYVSSETRPWIEDLGNHPRRAGVSAFGFGGTNFHVVLEEYTGGFMPQSDVNLTPRGAELFNWQGATRDEIRAELDLLRQKLAALPVDDLAGLASALHHEQTMRGALPAATCRLAMVATSIDDLTKKLERTIGLLADRAEITDPTGVFYSEAKPLKTEEVCFLYPGQGSQYVNMLRDLLIGTPRGQDTLSDANKQLADFLDRPLSRYIFPPPVFNEEDGKQNFVELSNTRVAQPALGVVELFVTDLLSRFGLHPGMAAGHSYGEHVALHAAGVLTREELVWLSAMRGQVCADIAADSPGGMAAVQANAESTDKILKELGLQVYLANMNAPDQTIIAGSEADIDRAVAEIVARGLRAKRIPVSAPFHTPLLEAGSHAMAEHFGKASFQRPKMPVYSNTTGKRHSDNPDQIRDLLTRHFSEPVHFEEEIRQIYADGAKVFIEAGPGKVLGDLVGRILKGEPVSTIPVDIAGRDGWTQFGHALARCYALGLPVIVSEWFNGRGLPQLAVDPFLETVKARLYPKKSDWILGPVRAEPVTPVPATKASVAIASAIIDIKRNNEERPAESRPVSRPAAAPASGPAAASAPTPPPSETPAAFRTPVAPMVTPVAQPAAVVPPRAAPVVSPPPAVSPSPTVNPSPTVVSAQVASVHKTTVTRRPSGITSRETMGIRRNVSPLASRLMTHNSQREQRPPARTLTRNSQAMTSHQSAPVEHAPISNGTGYPSNNGVAGAELYLEFQASTRTFLELQHAQQLLMEKFLDTQERMLAMCLGKGTVVAPTASISIAPPPAAAIPAPAPYMNGHATVAHHPAPAPVAPTPVAVAPAPAAIPTPARPPVAVPTAKAPAPPSVPAPAAPKPVAAPVAESPKPAPVAAKPAAAAPALAPVAAASAGGPPPVSQFRKDLLAVISERTGYPEDMLDEELPLEAGLGIDSIKTVEIFSTLKQYHAFMQDDDRDEEETLAAFTQMKTIKDIIDSYQQRYEVLTSGGGSSNGAANGKHGVVERHAVTAVDAPVGEGAPKKNSLAST